MNENEACGGKYKTLQLDDLLCVQSSVIIITIMMIPFTNCLLSFHVSTAATTRGDVIVFSYSAPGCC